MKDKTVFIFGEVLFDVFEDGQTVLGGAPFNVAWHLHGFGASPLFISRIGADTHGQKITETMQGWGMSLDGLQQDPQHPTGAVNVRMAAGQPSYDIQQDVAYDHIEPKVLEPLLAQRPPQMIYHGSLISRHEHSRHSLQRLKDQARVPVFVDINLRAPWHSRQQAEPLLQGIDWLKLNEEELEILAAKACPTQEYAEAAANELRRRYHLQAIIVTQGHRGAFCVSDAGLFTTDSPATEDLVDTVGAGDALSSVLILGLLNHWQLGQTLQRGVAFASAICEQKGATANNPQLYEKFSQQWGLSRES